MSDTSLPNSAARSRGETFILPNDGSLDERSDQWQEMISATHQEWITRPGDPEQPFSGSIRRWWIDDLALLDCECTPFSGSRQKRQINTSDGEFFTVLIILDGREAISQGDAKAMLGPGDAVTWDSTQPARFTVLEPLTKRSLVIPRSAIEEVGGTVWAQAGIALASDSPAGRLFVNYLDSVRGVLPELSRTAATAARNATLELLIGALRPEIEGVGTGAGPALREAIDRYIERNLLHPELSPSMIAAAHGVSSRTVNRIFSATGETVSDTIRIRRLARARLDLTGTDLTVATIASRWGFSDASHFSRSFKSHYGRSPSAIRAQHLAAAR